jgi:hypothetical protein
VIEKFIHRFDAKRGAIRASFAAKAPEDYKAIVRAVATALHDEDDYESPDPERVHQIDDGHYQGTLVFVIGAQGYQPSTYWYVKVGYGSCSGCDTLERIRMYCDEPPSPEQVEQYMTLAVHVLQGIKQMDPEEA